MSEWREWGVFPPSDSDLAEGNLSWWAVLKESMHDFYKRVPKKGGVVLIERGAVDELLAVIREMHAKCSSDDQYQRNQAWHLADKVLAKYDKGGGE